MSRRNSAANRWRRIGLLICSLVVSGAEAAAQDAGNGGVPLEAAVTSNRLTYHFGFDYMLQASSRQDYPFYDDRFRDPESFLWWRLRPRFEARSRHVNVVIEGQDTHSAGGSFSVRKGWLDLLNAYVDVRDLKGFAFRVGRQQADLEVIPRMVRTPDFAAVLRSFDVAEVGWANRRTDIRAFVFKPVENLPSKFNRQKAGELLWTAYGRRALTRRAGIQSYVIARHNREVTSESGARGDGAVYAWEMQANGPTPTRYAEWTVETVLQRGHYANDRVHAWGMFLRGDIDLPGPHVMDVRYSAATGDRNTGDGIRGVYDTFYSASSNFGSLGQIRGANVRSLSVGGTYVMSSPLALFWRYFNTHLFDRRDVWYGAVAPNISQPDASSTFLGHEIDLLAVYRVHPRLLVRAGYFHFFTGGYVRQTAEGTPREIRLQLIGGI